jgi:hypothetical protein
MTDREALGVLALLAVYAMFTFTLICLLSFMF